MEERSSIDINKLNKVPAGHPFEYRDIVKDDLPIEEHTVDGSIFKAEVEKGLYSDVKVDKNTDNRVLYRKLK